MVLRHAKKRMRILQGSGDIRTCGLRLYGLRFTRSKRSAAPEEAERIGKKYLLTVEGCFANTGKLWEKYDAVKGGKATANEYTETEMLGWTAGVYNDIYEEINQ